MNRPEWRNKQILRLKKIYDTWQNRGANTIQFAKDIKGMIKTVKKKRQEFHTSDQIVLIHKLEITADLLETYGPEHDRIIRNSLLGSMDILDKAA